MAGAVCGRGYAWVGRGGVCVFVWIHDGRGRVCVRGWRYERREHGRSCVFGLWVGSCGSDERTGDGEQRGGYGHGWSVWICERVIGRIWRSVWNCERGQRERGGADVGSGECGIGDGIVWIVGRFDAVFWV